MKLHLHLVITAMALTGVSATVEQGNGAAPAPTAVAASPLAEEYAQLQRDLDAAWAEFFRPELEAKTPEESDRIKHDLTRERPDVKFRPRFQDLARRAEKTDIGYAAWRQVFRMSRYRYATALQDQQEARAAIFRDFMQSPLLASFPELVGQAYQGQTEEKRLELQDAALLEISGKSQVSEAVASALAERSRIYLRRSPELSRTLSRAVAEKYSSTQAAKVLQREIFARENIVVGRPAPDFEAVDQEGVKFKLSDYRGKVVFVDFWAFWCVPCVQAMPHHIAMVERLKGRPFAMIGVDADKDHAFFARKAREIGINFRNAMDGKSGEIATSWKVGAWPTGYVIDARGIIRAKDGSPEEVDKLIETLLDETK